MVYNLTLLSGHNISQIQANLFTYGIISQRAQLPIFSQIWVIWPRNVGWMLQISNTAPNAYIDQQTEKMIFLESTGQERYENLPMHYSHKRNEESAQLSFIQQFFDANVFEKKLLSQQSSQEKSDNSAAEPERKDSDQTGNHETEVSASKKSIFHNFQKHLITLLRKIIEMGFSSGDQNTNEQLGVLLWNAFKRVPSYNKQTFHMIFGVSNFDHFEAQLQKVASKYKQFRPLWNRYSSDQIFEAQTFIRKQVVQQMSRINKNGIRACCNVHNFETFYQYLSSFLVELKDGPITTRMSKTRKLVVMAKISKNSPNQ